MMAFGLRAASGTGASIYLAAGLEMDFDIEDIEVNLDVESADIKLDVERVDLLLQEQQQ